MTVTITEFLNNLTHRGTMNLLKSRFSRDGGPTRCVFMKGSKLSSNANAELPSLVSEDYAEGCVSQLNFVPD
jgi:hypothetical protein